MLRKVVFVLFLVSTYLEVPLYLTKAFFIPSFFTILFLTPVLAVMYHKRIYKYEAIFVGQVFFVLLLTALLSPEFEHVDQKLLGLFQTVVSIVGGVLVLKLMANLQRRWTARILLLFSVALLIGALLEVAGPLRPISDAFRELAYGQGGYFVYDQSARDAGITGFPRPKFFTSEPSLLAIGFFAFANSWLILAYSKSNLYAACLGTLLMLVLTGSLVLVLSLAVSLIVMLYYKNNVSSLTTVVILTCVAGLAVVSLEPTIISNLLRRGTESFDYYSTINPSSQNIRLVFPFITLIDVLWASPLFGVGISGKEVVGNYSRLPVKPEFALGTNAFAALFIYLGLLGALLFVKAFWDYWRRLRLVRIVLLLALIFALSQSMGGFETPRFWGYVFLFIGVVRMRAQSEDRGP